MLDLINTEEDKIVSDGPPTDAFDRNDHNISLGTHIYLSKDGAVSVVDFDGSIYIVPTAELPRLRLTSRPFVLLGSVKDCPIKPFSKEIMNVIG